MPNVEEDESRENRIAMEIIVDAYDEEEQAMGWYYYLNDNLNFPFKAKWVRKGRKSSSPEGKEVEVVEMSSEDECSHDMFVEVLYKDATGEDTFSARLSDIEPIDADSETLEAIADWHYWVGRGYEF